MVLSLGQELREIEISTCSSRGCWMGSPLSEAPGTELSCLRPPIHLRRQTSKGDCWLQCKYSQLSISYRICFSNYLYFSLMTQYEAKLLLAKLQVAERSRAIRACVLYLLECVTSKWAVFVLSLLCIFERTQSTVVVNRCRSRNGFLIL